MALSRSNWRTCLQATLRLDNFSLSLLIYWIWSVQLSILKCKITSETVFNRHINVRIWIRWSGKCYMCASTETKHQLINCNYLCIPATNISDMKSAFFLEWMHMKLNRMVNFLSFHPSVQFDWHFPWNLPKHWKCTINFPTLLIWNKT